MADDDSMPAVESAEEQLALNESTFRDVNEAIESGRGEREGLVPFVCECGRLGCTDVVELTLPKYEDVRAGSRCFLVAPGLDAWFEQIRRAGTRSTDVAKPEGPLGDIADRTDPRKESG